MHVALRDGEGRLWAGTESGLAWIDGERANAAKFTADGVVLVRVFTRGDEALVEVRDTGSGMPPEVVAKLFRPFVQADASVAGTHGGTGLGLVISRELARLLGGEIHVQSTVGEGSVFSLALPRAVHGLDGPW